MPILGRIRVIHKMAIDMPTITSKEKVKGFVPMQAHSTILRVLTLIPTLPIDCQQYHDSFDCNKVKQTLDTLQVFSSYFILTEFCRLIITWRYIFVPVPAAHTSSLTSFNKRILAVQLAQNESSIGERHSEEWRWGQPFLVLYLCFLPKIGHKESQPFEERNSSFWSLFMFNFHKVHLIRKFEKFSIHILISVFSHD